MSTLQPNPARLNQPSSAKRAYRNSRLREHLTHPTEQSTVIMFNRRMFYALSILKIGRSLAHQLAHRTNFSKPPSHNLHWQGKLHRRGNTRCRGPRGEGSNMNLQASAFVKKRKSTIVIHSNPCYITITHPANSNNSWGIPFLQPSIAFRPSLLLAWFITSWPLYHHSLSDAPQQVVFLFRFLSWFSYRFLES